MFLFPGRSDAQSGRDLCAVVPPDGGADVVGGTREASSGAASSHRRIHLIALSADAMLLWSD
jgi:hypothetical protein